MLLGVDTGGTFTDFVLFTGKSLKVHKVLSTPHAPEQAILQGISELGITGNDRQHLRVIHGSTVATNAVLERKGVRTVYITNRGLRDVLIIGRQARERLYDLQPPVPPPLIERERCLETGGRLAADGSVVEALTQDDLSALRAQLEALQPQAVAINLLFSFLDDTAERAIEGIVPAGVFVSRASYILPEYREYERGVATYLNAWVGPLVQGYLSRLQHALAPAPLAVMQSTGGTMDAQQAGRQAVHMLLSGPAGGLAGASYIAAASGRRQLLTFDMGGTSTDVALIDGDIRLTSEGHIGPYPVAVPMVDMHTIGAGGGSIARVDAGGLLQVGPESAGADPGPACYGLGGTQATVTDANLVLGYLPAASSLGGTLTLDRDAARRAVADVGHQLGLGVEEAALGIIRLANEHMANALRVISVQRGIDPRGFTLVSFGGAGGLHVCALATALGLQHAMVPVHAGVLSALGMLVAPRTRHLSRTVNGLLTDVSEVVINRHLHALEQEGIAELVAEGVEAAKIKSTASIDARYRGQSFSMNVPWSDIDSCVRAFHDAHETRYGHRLDQAVELVNVRMALSAGAAAFELDNVAARNKDWQADSVSRVCKADGDRDTDVPVIARDSLGSGQIIHGPAIISETVATTWLAPGWQCECDASGNLLLEFTRSQRGR